MVPWEVLLPAPQVFSSGVLPSDSVSDLLPGLFSSFGFPSGIIRSNWNCSDTEMIRMAPAAGA